jgi:hypothetical protein
MITPRAFREKRYKIRNVIAPRPAPNRAVRRVISESLPFFNRIVLKHQWKCGIVFVTLIHECNQYIVDRK